MKNMKTLISKAILSIVGLLSAAAISFGQASDSTYKQPRAGGPNFYVEASTSYIIDALNESADFAGGDSNVASDLGVLAGFGATIGWRIGTVVKMQLETGVYSSSASTDSYYSYETYGKVKYDLSATPVLFSASFCIPLTGSGRAELRLAPTLGLYKLKLKISKSYPDDEYYESRSYSDTAFAYGFGVGYTYHFSRILYADLGLRLLGRTGMNGPDDKNHDSNNDTLFGPAIIGSISLAVGFKF